MFLVTQNEYYEAAIMLSTELGYVYNTCGEFLESCFVTVFDL